VLLPLSPSSNPDNKTPANAGFLFEPAIESAAAGSVSELSTHCAPQRQPPHAYSDAGERVQTLLPAEMTILLVVLILLAVVGADSCNTWGASSKP
jgi:hypothetical protein